MYTLDDLTTAKAEFDRLEQLWCDAFRHKQSNPYDGQARAASMRLREIEDDLKKRGIIPFSQHELLVESLNQLFPKAQSREVVVYQGKRYRKKFWPLELSKTGKTVKKWANGWEPLDEDDE